MSLDLNLFRAYTEGYMSEMKDVMSVAEVDSLVLGAPIITLELASRFLGIIWWVINTSVSTIRCRIFVGPKPNLSSSRI